MLNGVIGDYKEAERLPGEVAVTVRGLEELCQTFLVVKSAAYKDHPKYNAPGIRLYFMSLTNAILKWLGDGGDRDDDAMFATMDRLAGEYLQYIYEIAPPASTHYLQQVSRLRLAVTRMQIISATTYLPAGYALVELFVTLAILLVLLAKYTNLAQAYAIIVGTTIIYGGMLRLLADVDNPFEYDPIPEDANATGQNGGDEVDISVLLDYRRTLRDKIARDGTMAYNAAVPVLGAPAT